VEPRTISHYKIEKLLGVGGMGEVYLAEDARLHRKVALKVLPVRFTRDEERVRRFQREARAVSALNHPNILTIYEIGHDDATHFIATEYIAGKTLRDRMIEGPLSVEEVLDIGLAVGTALTAAHEKGIIHRDIKPDNIMLRSDGYVKVLDFGLAKLTETYRTADGHVPPPLESDPGTVMGTLQYVSPEQARAQQPDSRSDLFSLGVVLYEMIAGRPPFEGSNLLDIVHSIVSYDPIPPSQITPNTPVELDRIVLKALTKDRELRYQSARELCQDLRVLKEALEFESRLKILSPTASGVSTAQFPTYSADDILRLSGGAKLRSGGIPSETRTTRNAILATLTILALLGALAAFHFFGGGPQQIDSVAVLPFANVSNDPNTEYLSDGISESIIDSLSQLPEMQVIARSTVFRYKARKDVDPLTVGRELKVRAVVTGQLIQRGDTLVIRTALTDVAKGTQIWGEQYNRKLSDVLAVQEEIAREITDKLRSKLSGEDEKLLVRRNAENSEAFQLYLKGRYYRNKLSADAIRKAIEYFNQAIEKDPTYALAYAGLADAHYGLSNLFLAPSDAMPRAREAAKRALAIDDTLAEAHTSLALVEVWYDWDFASGEQQFRRAIALNPNDAEAHRNYGDFLLASGKFDQAILEKRRAAQLDPLSTNALWDVSRAYYYARRYPEALAEVQKIIELDDKFPYAYWQLASIHQQQGKNDLALAELRKAYELAGTRDALYVATEGYVNAKAGNREAALKAIAELKGEGGRSYTLPLFLARVYAGLGDNKEALRLLEECYAERSESVVWLNVDPTFDGLRNDPGFQALLARVGLQ
jgi:serine/threonine protein kinase/Tfp pilus assembly protein PilF